MKYSRTFNLFYKILFAFKKMVFSLVTCCLLISCNKISDSFFSSSENQSSRTPQAVVSAAGVPATLVISPVVATSTAGNAVSITVTIKDSTNKTVTNYLGTLHLTSTDGQAVLAADYTFTARDLGVHTFTGSKLLTAGLQTITVQDLIVGTLKATSLPISVLASRTVGSVALTVTGNKGLLADGLSTTTLQALVKDPYKNPIPTLSVVLKIPLNGGKATSRIVATNTLGLSNFTVTSSTKAGPYTYTVTAGTLSSASVILTFLNPLGLASQITLAQQPGGGTAGKVWTQQPVIQIRDFLGNIVTTGALSNAAITVRVKATSPNSTAVLVGTQTVIAVAGVATFKDLHLDTAGANWQLTFSAPGFINLADLGTRTVTVDSAAFSVLGSSTVGSLSLAVMGSPIIVADGLSTTTLQAVVKDPYQNPIANQMVSLILPVNGGSALTLVFTDALGQANFLLTSSTTVGSYNYVATLAGLTTTPVSVSFIVGPPTQLVLIQQPNLEVVAQVWSKQPVVQVRDGAGHLVTSGPLANATISVGLKSSPNFPTIALLSGTKSVVAVGGVATFTDLQLDTALDFWQLTFSAPGFPNAADSGTHTVSLDSAAFRIVAALKFIYVDAAAAAGGTGAVNSPLTDLQAAIDQVVGTAETHIQLRGGVYKGPYSINNKTTPLFIEPFNGESVAINCAKPQTGWTLYQGSIYQTHVAAAMAQVFYKDQFLLKARYPSNGFIFAKAYSPNNTVNTAEFFNSADVANLNALGGVVGADITARITDYWYNSAVVTSLDATTNVIGINGNKFGWSLNSCSAADYNTANCPATNHGWGFFFANKLWMLTEPGHWVFDSSTNMLYVRMPNDSQPSNTDIEVAEDGGCFKVFNSSNINVNNLTIKNSGAFGIYATNSSQLTFDKVDVRNSKTYGVFLDGKVTGMTIKNSNISGTGSDAVTGNYEGSDVVDSQFLMQSNTLSQTGNSLGPAFTSAAISLPRGFVKAVIQNNFIHDIPYVGMILPPSSSAINNTITNFCMDLSDCGAIYAGGRMSGATITGNLIYNSGKASLDGKPTGYPTYNLIGIYLDDFMNNAIVRNNIITNTPIGIFLHNAHDNLIENNIVSGFSESGFYSQEDDILRLWSFDPILGWLLTPFTTTDATGALTCYPSTSKNTLSNNKFADSKGKYSLGTSSYITPAKIAADGVTGCQPPLNNLDRLKSSVTLNSNSYVTLFRNEVLNSNSLTAPAMISDLINMQIETTPSSSTTGFIPDITATDLTAAVNFATQYQNFVTWSIAANESISLRQPVCSLGTPTVSGPCLQFNASPNATTDSLLISPTFASTTGTGYHIHMKVFNSGTTDVMGWLSMIRNGPTYEGTATAVSPVNYVTLRKGVWTTVDWYATGSVDLTNSRIDLDVPSNGFSYYIAEFQVQTATLSKTDYSKYIGAVLNPDYINSISASCAQISSIGCTGWNYLGGASAIFPLIVSPRSMGIVWHGL